VQHPKTFQLCAFLRFKILLMKKLILNTILIGCVLIPAFAIDKEVQENSLHSHALCVLKSSGISSPSYIPPGDYSNQTKLHLYSLDGTTSPVDVPHLSKAVFNLTFDDSVSEQTKTATMFAANLWSEILTTDQTIEVYVTEKADEEDSKTLASAYAYDAVLDFASSYLPLHYNPIVISNRKLGSDISVGLPDIVVNVNASQEFYYGTDGKCPANKHDLVSILLHELGHGLGFFDSISATASFIKDSVASYGVSGGVGYAYDYFLINKEGVSLLDGISGMEDNVELFSKVTSNNVYFNGPLVRSLTNQVGAKIFAPTTWQSGSSISHLDESTYAPGNTDSLMTPIANLGEVIHNPGALTIAMLGDVGWDHVWIDYQRVPDTEDVNALLTFQATVKADATLEGLPTLYYREKGAIDPTFHAKTMTAGLIAGEFSLPFQMAGIPVKYEYYIGVPASSGRIFTYPARGAEDPVTLNVGPDDVPPVLSHTPAAYHYSHRQIFSVQLNASDNIAMGGVNMEVWLDGEPVGTVAAQLQESGSWIASNGMPDMSGKTVIQYRFTGYDASIAQNTTVYPAGGGFFTLPIERIYAPASVYSNNMELGADDFILDGFEVKTLTGFSSSSLGSIHPYLNNGDKIEYYAYLRQPIIVQSGMKITFDEIVLVEPGETGVTFGENEFWDYVVVEVSGDRGRTWKPLLPGWDSNLYPAIAVLYNNGIAANAQDSTTVGVPDMFRSHTLMFDQSENVVVGQEVMLRFHLHSDPYAVGWGWEIDNIVIGQ